MLIFVLSIIFFILTLLLTGCMRYYALKKNIIDNPNERSSHIVPTPRGGGVAIVISYILAVISAILLDWIDIYTSLVILVSGSTIAILGFLDDHGHINALVRLAIHFLVSIGIVIALGGFLDIQIFNGFKIGFMGNIIAVLFLVWLLNLYNFMDGINGIATIEVVTVSILMGLLYQLSNINDGLLVLLASCALGFLFWNFPKAKIFMGDAGSGFLGIILGVLGLLALKSSIFLFCAWLICLGVFIVDATFTLIKRVVSGHKLYDAHRSHAYQIASRKYNSHVIVSVSVAVINIFWLFPIAYYIIVSKPIYPEIFVILAYIPLIVLTIYFKAGDENA